MARRLRKTLADYVVIAVSPALIMGLVAGLVFFLLKVFYHGAFPGRLQLILGLFIFAAVLIARIAIDEGKGRAALFSLALAAVIGLAISKFSTLGFLLNAGFLAIIWWCANKLTWDSTVIDDQEDASGEGLMQLVGMEQPPERERNVDDPAESDEHRANAPPTNKNAGSSWRTRIARAKGKPHTPGIWVVYFSLAALPIFGFLHRFIPTDAASRKAAFSYVFLYVGCALSLLVTTSFLGLRRYLRQRRLEMSSAMTITWISVGGGMVLALLAVATILPRPGIDFNVLKPPFEFSSPKDLVASKFGWGREGVQENGEKQNGEKPSGGKQSGGKQSGGKQSGGKQSGGKQSGGEQSGGEQSGGKQSGGKQSGGKQSGGKQSGGKQSGGEQSGGDQQKESSAGSEQQQPESSQREAPRQPPPTGSVLQKISSGFGWLVKLVFYLALAILVVWLLWKYHRELIQAARELWQDFLKFLNNLFGRTPPVEEVEEVETAPVVRPPAFATFVDPFTSGRSARMKPKQLIDYSFRAFEAWAYERGLPRRAEQTALEFAQLAGRRESRIAREARYLAELYSHAAYSSATTAAAATEKLRAIWWIMNEEAAQPK